jgi:hypothetical protein
MTGFWKLVFLLLAGVAPVNEQGEFFWWLAVYYADPYVEYVNLEDGWWEVSDGFVNEVIGIDTTAAVVIEGVAYLDCEIQLQQRALDFGESVVVDPESGIQLEVSFAGQMVPVLEIEQLVEEDICRFVEK